MSDFTNQRLADGKQFETLVEPGNSKPDLLTVPLGYIEPGHGLIGGSTVIVTFQRCTNTQLWCYSHDTSKENFKHLNLVIDECWFQFSWQKGIGSYRVN